MLISRKKCIDTDIKPPTYEENNISPSYIYWLVVYLPLWKMMEFVSWDDYPQYMESHNPAMFQTTNQIYAIYELQKISQMGL